MIHYKNEKEITIMKESCQLAASVLDFIEEHIQIGTSTEQLNVLCHDYITQHKAIPSPLNYRGFPKSICTSVNDVVCHGIPSKKDILKDGDIINVDITTYFKEYHGDTSRTFFVGKCSRKARDLVQHTYEAMWKGIQTVRHGSFIGDIGQAIKDFTLPLGYSIVEEYTGHGIGKNFHEDPYVLHNNKKGTGPVVKPGMVFTIEPMLNVGKRKVHLLDDDWTVVTSDGKISAQFEHTIAVRENCVEVLTLSPNAKENPVVWTK